MRQERRNHYRLLFVQPEAPPEVIKAAYRALMSAARVHPDLGGDPEQAARLNAAYAVLSDPEQRRLYDLGLKRRRATAAAAREDARGGTPGGTQRDTTTTASLACPFCAAPVRHVIRLDSLCGHCSAPLCPVPEAGSVAAAGPVGELLGRRRAARHATDAEVHWRLPGQASTWRSPLRDLSFSGLSLQHPVPVPVGSRLHLRADKFEAVAEVVACRPLKGQGHSVHARLLTISLNPGARGVVLNAQA